ncbi:MAG: glycosyltransferase [Vicinamibacterales bacterium]
MRIGIQAWGSEGDIRPFLALAHGLVTRGHDVEFLYTELGDRRYDAAAEALGVRARAVGAPVHTDPEALSRMGWEMLKAANPLEQSKLIVRYFFDPVVDEMHAAAVDLCQRVDLLVSHFFLYPTRAAAEAAGVPEISVTLAPSTVPSRAIHPTGLPRLGAWGNAAGWWFARLACNFTFRGRINAFRASHGLDPIRDVMTEAWASRRLNLVAASPTLCPRPDDWPPQHRVTGFLHLPRTAAEPVPDAVEAFIADGPAPVFVGFGSLMPEHTRDLDQTLAIVRDACRATDARAIVQVPPAHGDRTGVHGRLLLVSRLHHAAVFPRCAGVVHHGGAGTIQTALAAGVPSVVVPHVADQYFWAERLEELGVAPPAVPRRSWTARDLVRQLQWLGSHSDARERAEQLGYRMSTEDGVGVACAALEDAGLRWTRKKGASGRA